MTRKRGFTTSLISFWMSFAQVPLCPLTREVLGSPQLNSYVLCKWPAYLPPISCFISKINIPFFLFRWRNCVNIWPSRACESWRVQGD